MRKNELMNSQSVKFIRCVAGDLCCTRRGAALRGGGVSRREVNRKDYEAAWGTVFADRGTWAERAKDPVAWYLPAQAHAQSSGLRVAK